MQVVTKAFPVKIQIGKEIARQVITFFQTNGFEPVGLALGPNDYLSLKTELEQEIGTFTEQEHFTRTATGEIREFLGLPVHLQLKPGIALVIPPEKAPYFAMGMVEEDPPSAG